MGKRIAAKDWSTTPFGPIDSWPQSLKTAISLILGAKFPMFVWWGRDFAMFYNDAYIPPLGPEKHPQFLGRPAHEPWADIWDVVGPLAEGVYTTGKSVWFENLPLFMVRTGYLEETCFTFSYSPAREESGAIGGVFCTCQETTERVLAERRLRVLQELGIENVKNVEAAGESAVRTLSGNANDVPFALIYITGADGKSASLVGASGIKAGTRAAPEVIDLSRSVEESWPLARIFKSKKSERIDGLRSLFPGDMPPVPCEEMPDSAQLIPIELAGHDTPAGFVILGISPRLMFNESYQGFFGLVIKQIANNISNIRAIEEERKRAEALAEIDRAKTAFFSNVSHEFRTPLTLMLGPLEDMLANGKGPLPPAIRQESEVIHRNALRMLKLVNTLLDFSRIEAGRVQAVYEPTDLASLTSDLASTFRSIIEKSGMKLIVDCSSLSEAVFVDREMWEKIVLNLLSNAFKYTLKGEIRVSLKKSSTNTVELSVSDTGGGIPEQELPKLFERFHRVQGARARTHEGTGIGLALIQQLVKFHGGSVEVKSVLGQGSTFTISIPLGYAHLPQKQISKSQKSLESIGLRVDAFVQEALHWTPDSTDLDVIAKRTDESPLSKESKQNGNNFLKKRILIVDDNADMRDYVRKLLESRYEVITANNGKKALDTILNFRPDLVISDIMMPVMDGIELLKAIRADVSLNTLPIILLSARAGEEAKISGLEAGADDYLIKPFSANELLARVGAQIKLNDVRSRLDQMKDEFIGMVSHELRTPVTIIHEAVSQLAEGIAGSLGDDQKRLVTFIDRSATYLIKIINNLLDITKLEAGKSDLNIASVDMVVLSKEVLSLLSSKAKSNGVEIRLRCEKPSLIFPVDGEKIQRVLTNLISNAIKFTDKGFVEVALTDNGDTLACRVSDTGRGITQEDLPKVFSKFQQFGKKYPGQEKGTGLGLAICKGLVELHGGRIWVESELGKGTCFCFTLPKTTRVTERVPT